MSAVPSRPQRNSWRTELMTVRVMTLTAALVLIVGSLSGDDREKASGPPDMEAMMTHATPGEAHKVFQLFAGKRDYDLKLWMVPSAPAMEMNGTSNGTRLTAG